jgi:hypothetical protein
VIAKAPDVGAEPTFELAPGTGALDIATGDLDDATRLALAKLWQERADSESAVRTVFHQLADAFAATGAHPEVITLARRAAEDEVRHAAVCTELATAYRREPVAPAVEPAVRLPDYVPDRRLRAALHAVNLCCIGETIAVAFVEACLQDCTDPALREIHRRHLADEVRHARVGWAHLASLTAAERAEVESWVPELVRAQLSGWEERLGELPEAGVPGHAYPPRAELVRAVQTAVRELVLPGFEYVGISVQIPAQKFGPESIPL